MQTDRLPQCLEAERAMLGSILLNPLLIEEAKRDCPVEALYSHPNRRVLVGMLAIHERNEVVDSSLLIADLERTGDLQAAGGAVGISNLSYGLPNVATLKHYIARIREAHRRRWLIKFSALLQEKALDGEQTDEELLSYAISQLDSAKREHKTRRLPASLEELADDQLFRYELFLKGISDALPTGFQEIDDHLFGGGLVPCGLYYVAASTSLGKTTFALDVASHIASTGHRGYIVSREMSRESIFDRLVAVESEVERWKIRPGIWESDYKRLLGGVSRLSGHPLILEDTSLTVSDVRGFLREYENRDQRVEFLVVDYLQLMQAEGKRESRNQEVGSLSRSLKGLAMEFRIPVLAISQLNRKPAQERREPELQDLRDSGEIEQDADAVFFLFGEKPDDGRKLYDRTFKCAKQREGPLFRLELPFNGEFVTYRKRRRLEAVS